MSDDGCCGDTGGDCSYDTGGGCDDTGGGYNDTEGCCDDTGGCCDDTGGTCDENGACIDTAPCEETTTYMETTLSDNVDVCIDQPYETFSYDRSYGYEDTYRPTTYRPTNNRPTANRPVYVNLSANNNTFDITDFCERYIKWFGLGFLVIFSKFECQCLFQLKFSHVNN